MSARRHRVHSAHPVAALGLAAILAACTGEDIGQECADGTTCPPGLVCSDEGCVDPNGDCGGQPDGIDCPNGTCQSGTCVEFFCGNGIVEGDEVCDGPPADTNCVDAFNFDRGTPSCQECAGAVSTTCSYLRFRNLAVDSAQATRNRAIFALGSEVWVGGASYGVHFDGMRWLENDVRATAIHGTSRDNIWAHFGDEARHFDGENWGDPLPVPGARGALHVVSETEAYIAGNENGTPTVFKVNATNTRWDVEWARVGSSNGFARLTGVGSTLIAVGQDGPSIRRDGIWTDISARLPNGFSTNGIAARAHDDFYVSGLGGVQHFNGTAFTEVLATGAHVAILGDLVVFIGRNLTTRIHRPGTPIDELVVVASPGSPGPFGGNPIVDVYANETSAFAITQGAAFRFDGSGTSTYVQADVDTTLDVSITRGEVHYLTQLGTARTAVAVSSAFGESPAETLIAAPGALKIWGQSTDTAFVTTGGGVQRWEKSGNTFTRDLDGRFEDIDGLASKAVVVGDGGAAFVLEDDEWISVTGGSIVGTTPLKGAYAAADGFAAVGDLGAIFVYRGSTWEQIDTGTTADFTAVDGISLDLFWAVSRQGEIVRCAAGNDGYSCADVGPQVGIPFSDIAVAAADDITATAGGDVFHFDGERWMPVRLGINATAVAVEGDVIWFAGGRSGPAYLEGFARMVPWVAADN